jgi:hypothetical protein
MSKIRVSKTAAKTETKQKKEWPAVVYFWAFGLAISGYAVGRVGLSSFPHPYHWLSGLVGGVLGIPLGWLWYRWRGDIF